MLQVYPASGEHQPVPLPLKAGEALQEARHPCLGPVHLPVLEPAQRSRPGGATHVGTRSLVERTGPTVPSWPERSRRTRQTNVLPTVRRSSNSSGLVAATTSRTGPLHPGLQVSSQLPATCALMFYRNFLHLTKFCNRK